MNEHYLMILKTIISDLRATGRHEAADYLKGQVDAAVKENIGLLGVGQFIPAKPVGSPEKIGAAPPEGVRQYPFTAVKIMRLLAEGISDKEIGFQTNLSEHTIRSHMRYLRQHLDCQNRTQIAIKYTARDLPPKFLATLQILERQESAVDE